MSRQIAAERPLITANNPKSPISEAYRVVRTNIDFSGIDQQLQLIMVTSPMPGEGKSTTAANLAIVYAQSDKKVLLIDGDLRKPTMHKTFNLSNRWGLTSLLTGKVTINEVIRETQIDNLEVLAAGPIPPNPSEILSSKKMEDLLEELKGKYDMIIMDTPPVLAVTDAQILSTKCDGVVLVLTSGRVKRDFAIKAKANLDHVNARILGVVLNNVDAKNSENYYYYYYGNSE